MTPKHSVHDELTFRRRNLQALQFRLLTGGCGAAREVAGEALAELTRILGREAAALARHPEHASAVAAPVWSKEDGDGE
jgi:hypothetical protein